MTKEEAHNVLRAIYSIIEDSAMTGGAFEAGRDYSMKMYNRIRTYAIKEEWIDEFIFDELTEENCLNTETLGVAAGLLAAGLK